MRITIFTSITANYLAKARVLAGSVRRHNPAWRFNVLLVERDRPAVLGADEPFDEVVLLGDLEIEEPTRWVFSHTLVEACTAVKGPYIHQLLSNGSCDIAVYLDPDMLVTGRLEAIEMALETASIALTPHMLSPDPAIDGIPENELSCLRHGAFNLGFLAVRATEGGIRFADWWRSRLLRYCTTDFERGLFTDQKWVDLVPALFTDVAIMRDPGYNVATWNLARREVEGTVDDGLRVDGQPLRLFHFSGFDSGAQLAMLIKYASSVPALFDLRERYIDACARSGQSAVAPLEWTYGRYSDGEPIDVQDRRAYRDRRDLQEAFPDPFETGGRRSFRAWLRSSR